MYWVISGPDTNPLTGTVLIGEKVGFWSQAAPIFSFLCSVCSIGVAIYVANRAWNLTKEQKNIAEQARQIAQDKLEVDVFNKRFEIYSAFHTYYGVILTKTYSKTIEAIAEFGQFRREIAPYQMIFEEKDIKKFREYANKITILFEFRLKYLDIDYLYAQDRDTTLKDFFHLQNDIVRCSQEMAALMITYTPEVLKKRSTPSNPSPASHPEPQPTAQEQAQ